MVHKHAIQTHRLVMMRMVVMVMMNDLGDDDDDDDDLDGNLVMKVFL